MTLVRAALACSLDGYIAARDGNVDWLHRFFCKEIDFAAFMATIGATVAGRRTFDEAFARLRGGGGLCVLTHRPLPPAAKGIEVWSGELRPHVERLREQLEPGGKDIWLLGGGEALRAFAQEDLIDRWEISRMPILLGDGVPLFPRHDGGESPLQLVHHRALPNGIVEEHYEPVRGGAAPPPRAGKRRR